MTTISVRDRELAHKIALAKFNVIKEARSVADHYTVPMSSPEISPCAVVHLDRMRRLVAELRALEALECEILGLKEQNKKEST